jgi:hypothetical protein
MGLRALINAKCKQCIYDPTNGGGTWREQVQACTVQSCPLFEVRPKSNPRAKLPKEDEQARSGGVTAELSTFPEAAVALCERIDKSV